MCNEEEEAFDSAIKTNIEKYAMWLEKESWTQASISIRGGSLGLRSSTDRFLPCFLSSSYACTGLVNSLLRSFNMEQPYCEVHNATDARSEHQYSSQLHKEIKSVWDDLACRDSLNALLNARSPWDKCRLLAALESHTTCWSEAFPIANVGNLISADELRITIALWTGCKIFESAECHCGKTVDKLGLHGLSCSRNTGHWHSVINSILKTSFNCINLPSSLEPPPECRPPGICPGHRRTRRGGGTAAPHCLEKFQGKLCFSGQA